MSRRRFQGSLGEFHRSVRGFCGSLCSGVFAEVQGLRKQSLRVIGDDPEVIQRSVPRVVEEVVGQSKMLCWSLETSGVM